MADPHHSTAPFCTGTTAHAEVERTPAPVAKDHRSRGLGQLSP